VTKELLKAPAMKSKREAKEEKAYGSKKIQNFDDDQRTSYSKILIDEPSRHLN
jgi:uncharacterized protein YaaW (UPF0174 family)